MLQQHSGSSSAQLKGRRRGCTHVSYCTWIRREQAMQVKKRGGFSFLLVHLVLICVQHHNNPFRVAEEQETTAVVAVVGMRLGWVWPAGKRAPLLTPPPLARPILCPFLPRLQFRRCVVDVCTLSRGCLSRRTEAKASATRVCWLLWCCRFCVLTVGATKLRTWHSKTPASLEMIDARTG